MSSMEKISSDAAVTVWSQILLVQSTKRLGTTQADSRYNW
jgi:hypothetical protein